MNNLFVKNSVRFVALGLLQILVFSHIDYLGYVNPMVYILFIMLYPYEENKLMLLIVSFLFGLSIDCFSNTGGLHAASSVFVAYIRSFVLSFVFGKNIDYQEVKLLQYPFAKNLVYVTILVVLHHTLFYFLEIFNFNHLSVTFLKIGISSIFTVFICLLLVYIFGNKK